MIKTVFLFIFVYFVPNRLRSATFTVYMKKEQYKSNEKLLAILWFAEKCSCDTLYHGRLYGLTFAKSLNWSEDNPKAVNKTILFFKFIRLSSSISSCNVLFCTNKIR